MRLRILIQIPRAGCVNDSEGFSRRWFCAVIGIDVAADKVDVNDSHSKITHTIPNTVVAITRQLVAKIQSKADTLVVCEATGGYEHVVVDAMHQAGIAVCVANPRQVRDFAIG